MSPETGKTTDQIHDPIPPTAGRHYGWVPPLPDRRDKRYKAPRRRTLPPLVDISSKCPPIFDQQSLGSCVSNAVAAADEFDQAKQGMWRTPPYCFRPSRLMIYYGARLMEGTVFWDSGCSVRDGVKSLARWGACSEYDWPYDISQFAVKPTRACFEIGEKHKSILYRAVDQDLNEMRGCLADGLPFLIGFSVYESFESDMVTATGDAPMPTAHERVLGGHCVLVTGYNDVTRRFKFRNSWHRTWGNEGYGTFPYEFLLSNEYADDFWVINAVDQ